LIRLPCAFTMGKPDRPRHQLWSFVYLAVRRVLSLLLLFLRRSGSKEIEILVVRHELEVLRRNQPRPRFEPADRAWLCALSRLLAKDRRPAFFVRPETLLRWHRQIVTRHWTYPHRLPGRPPIGEDLVTLIVAMASDNPTWGYQRIRGELLGLGHRVAASTIAQVLKTHGLGPALRRMSATWRQLLRQQASSIVACDFFSVDTVPLRRLYVLFFIHHASRRVFLAGITTNPTWAWVTQCARNVTADLRDAGIGVKFVLLSATQSSAQASTRCGRARVREFYGPCPGPQRECHL
jgi:putative transposase